MFFVFSVKFLGRSYNKRGEVFFVFHSYRLYVFFDWEDGNENRVSLEVSLGKSNRGTIWGISVKFQGCSTLFKWHIY